MSLGIIQEPRGGQLPPILDAPPAAADGLKLHRLRTPAQIATVLHLREEIDLSVHAAAGPQFGQLEKKEMSWASSWGSSSTEI